MALNPNDEATVRKNIERFYEAFSHHDVDLLREVVTPDWQYLPELPGAQRGPEQMTSSFQNVAIALPDMKIEILDLLVHDNRVGVRAEVTGTQAGPLMGVEATSRPVRFAIHSFHEIQGTVISKTWHLEDWLGVFRQIGQLPRRLDLQE